MVEKKIGKKIKKCWKSSKNVKIQQKHQFSTFFYNFFWFFFTPFFGIFELRWQCSKFWLRWINFIFSKWLSYSHFTKSVFSQFTSWKCDGLLSKHHMHCRRCICTTDRTDYGIIFVLHNFPPANFGCYGICRIALKCVCWPNWYTPC